MKLPAAAYEGGASFAGDSNKEDCDRCDEDRQDAVKGKLKKCGSLRWGISEKGPFPNIRVTESHGHAEEDVDGPRGLD